MYEPLHRHRPAHRWTNGDLAAKVGTDLGLPPDEEQVWLLDTIFAEKAPEIPASFEVATIAPRQNIKTSTYGIAALADLFVFDVEKHLWTAHHGDTLKGTFNDFRSWIKSNPDYDDLVTFYEGHQDMSIVRKDTGASIEFQSRTGKAGRGLTGVKRITLDEALYLEPKHVGAVYPTMLTRPGAQVRIASSAGLETSMQLRRLRDRGRAGKDKRLAYVEYGAAHRPCARGDCSHAVGSEGCALDDRNLWWQANCALWAGRINEESLADQRNAMPPSEFMREFLSWWEDPDEIGGAIPIGRWRDLATEAEPPPPAALGVAADVDQVWLSLGASSRQVPTHLGSVQRLRADIDRAAFVAEVRRVQIERDCPVAIDPKGPAGFVIADLESAGVRLTKASVDDFIQACADLHAAVSLEAVEHGNYADLNAAVSAAGWRTVGDRRLFARKGGDIAMLEAVALARWAALNGGSVYESRGVLVL